MRKARTAVADELALEIRTRMRILGGLHDRLDLFAELVVRHAHDRDIRDRGMQGEEVLDLPRMDVDPAADDDLAGPSGSTWPRSPAVPAAPDRRNQTTPTSPEGSSRPSTSAMKSSPSTARPTEPGCSSHSSGPIAVLPKPSEAP